MGQNQLLSFQMKIKKVRKFYLTRMKLRWEKLKVNLLD